MVFIFGEKNMATMASNLPNSAHFSRTLETTNENDVSLDSTNYGRDTPTPNSCCSEDTVLSVGKEYPSLVEPNQTPPLSFKNIENHLNAISKLASTTLGDVPISPINSSSPFSNRLSPISSKSIGSERSGSPLEQNFSFPTSYSTNSSPPSSPKSTSQSSSIFFRQTPFKQNEVEDQNNPNLKFSIDNILKADFGRRITDPLNIKKINSRPKKSDFLEDTSNSRKNQSIPVDLTKGETTPESCSTSSSNEKSSQPMLWPAWVYCTRYSDRPSSGRSPRTRRVKKPQTKAAPSTPEEKRPRTAFSGAQLARLKHEFNENRYLTERRRQQLSQELGLNEAQIKIWFQNKRAKIKKASGVKNPLALQLMAQGLYNHSTVPLTKEEEELQELQNKKS